MAVKAVQQFMLGTVLNTRAQAGETLRQMVAAGYGGIELCSFMLRPASPVVRLLTRAAGMPVGGGGRLDWPELIREAGVHVVSLHTDLGSVEKDPSAVAAQVRRWGTGYAVITGMYRFPFGEERAVRGLANRLNRAGERLAAEGVSLLYHNHNCELLRVNPAQRACDLLLAETDPAAVNFEFDSYWFSEGGGDALGWMRTLGRRMKLWHVNDRGSRLNGPAMTPILKSDSMELGTGNLPLAALAAQAAALEVEAVILESHRNWIDKSPVKSFQLSADFLNRYF